MSVKYLYWSSHIETYLTKYLEIQKLTTFSSWSGFIVPSGIIRFKAFTLRQGTATDLVGSVWVLQLF